LPLGGLSPDACGVEHIRSAVELNFCPIMEEMSTENDSSTSTKQRGFISRVWPLLVISPLIVAVDFFVQVHAQSFSNVIYNPVGPSWKVEVLLICAGLYAVYRLNYRLVTWGFAFAIGGYAANCLAHLIYGPVADYIPTPFLHGGWEFNVADTCLSIGAVLMILSLILLRPLKADAPEEVPAETETWPAHA